MTRTSKLTTWGLLATLAATTLTPVLADPASQQKNKNNWRNLATVGAAIAGYGLLKGNSTATILGAAGGAYAANRYETDRRHQSQDNAYNNYNNNNGYRRYHRTGNGNNWNNNNQYRDNNWNDNRYNNDNRYSGDSSDNRQWADGRQNDRHHDNGRHLGWNKQHNDDGERD